MKKYQKWGSVPTRLSQDGSVGVPAATIYISILLANILPNISIIILGSL